MKLSYTLKLAVSSLFLFSYLTSASATGDVAKGLEIAKEADKRDTGFVDSTAKMVMELKNKQGQTNTREVRVKTLEMIGDGDKGLSIFDTPRDIKGTASLTYSHALKPDEQWLYLPA